MIRASNSNPNLCLMWLELHSCTGQNKLQEEEEIKKGQRAKRCAQTKKQWGRTVFELNCGERERERERENHFSQKMRTHKVWILKRKRVKMERKEKGGGESEREEKKKQGLMVKKLKQGMLLVGKRGGPCTPPPTWRLELDNNPTFPNNANISTSISARKLCANLWEIQPHHHYPVAKMSKNGARLRRHKRRENKRFQISKHLVDPPSTRGPNQVPLLPLWSL